MELVKQNGWLFCGVDGSACEDLKMIEKTWEVHCMAGKGNRLRLYERKQNCREWLSVKASNFSAVN